MHRYGFTNNLTIKNKKSCNYRLRFFSLAYYAVMIQFRLGIDSYTLFIKVCIQVDGVVDVSYSGVVISTFATMCFLTVARKGRKMDLLSPTDDYRLFPTNSIAYSGRVKPSI
jgi:hypothetical protein